MSSEENRRSARILELDARRAQQAKNQKNSNGTSEVATKQDLGGRQDTNQTRGRKKIKIRPVQDLVLNSIEYQHQKADTSKYDRCANSDQEVVMSSRTAIPEKNKLELFLSILERRDSRGIFAEPVNPKEVENYYDVIKEPMDFGTMKSKLHGGNYKTLEEFEHDVFLVSSNAMLFNASNTIYYRQARAIKELANKLFHALKTDPDKFDAEFSTRRVGSGCRDERSKYQEVQRRWTYRPRQSFVHNSPKQLKLCDKGNNRYLESLRLFVKDLGPTAQMVARRKVERCVDEAINFQNATSNYQLQAPKNQISTAASAQKGITTAPFFNLPGHSASCQIFAGGEMDFQSGTSKRERASRFNTTNICDVLSGGNAQASSTMETLGDFRGKMVQTISGGLDMGTAFKGKMVDQTVGIELGSFPISTTRDGNFDFLEAWNTSNPMSNMMQSAINMDTPIQTTEMIYSESRMQEFVPNKVSGGASSSTWQWSSPAMTGLSSSQANGSMHQMDSHYLAEGIHQIQGMANGEGPSCGGNFDLGSQVLDWFAPMELGPQPILDGWFQQQSVSAQMDLFGQAGPLQQRSWDITPPPHDHVMNASNMYGCERSQISGPREFSIGAPPDNRQKQPMLSNQQPQIGSWTGNLQFHDHNSLN